MNCKNCGKEFDGKFCPECGAAAVDEAQEQAQAQEQTQVEELCPKCGTQRAGSNKFCSNCGYNFDNPTQSVSEKVDNPTQRKLEKFMPLIAKIYRWLIAGGMLFVGLISLLCLTAPTLVESFFGEKVALCTGFAAIGGNNVDVTDSVVGASKMLLVVSLAALLYGGFQMFLAIKKPYSGIKKIYFWVIDGVIVLLLFILGCVVAGAAGSDEFMDCSVGSGFAMCVVMGLFGLIFLGARIFYELKLFKWEDTGLTQEQIEKTTEKKERKKLTKKQILAIVLPIVAVVLIIAIVVPTVSFANNIFRAGKVDKVNIGDSQEQVVKVLGEPYDKSDYRYEYYSDNYTKVLEQIRKLRADGGSLFTNLAKSDDEFDFDEDDFDDFDWDDGEDKESKLEEQLRTMVYKYICVEFDADKKVSSVLFDNERCDSKDYKKDIKSYELLTEKIYRYETTNVYYSTKYTDGSSYKGYGTIALSYFVMDYPLEWRDPYGNAYKETITISDASKPRDFDIIGAFTVPDGVTTIDEIFARTNVTSITLPSSVTTIKSDAFYYCDSLQTVYYQGDLAGWCSISFGNANANPMSYSSKLYIGDEQLSGDITIPSNVSSISAYAFYNCKNLTTVSIPSSVTTIGGSAFSACSNLTIYCVAASKPSGWSNNWNYSNRPVIWDCKDYGETEDGWIWRLTSRDTMAIDGYSGTLTDLEIPSSLNGYSVTDIGSNAFYNNTALTSMTIPSGITSIGEYAFGGCKNLQEVKYQGDLAGWCKITFGNGSANPMYYASNLYIGGALLSGELTIPSSITEIKAYTFYNCSSLTSITLPSGITGIGNYAFSSCSSLTSITIPSGVTSIGNYAFSDCSNVINIAIPSGVTSIGKSAFYGCKNLQEVKYQGDLAGWCKITFEDGSANPMYYASNLYIGGVLLSGELAIPSSIKAINAYTFYNCSELTSVTIPSGVTSIGEYAFSSCSSLTSIAIPSGVTSIGNFAFYGCSNLTGITIPSSVTSISDYTFAYCSGLTSITIPSSVTSIGSDAFYNCSSLTSITIPSSVTSIGDYAFYNCSSLTSITIPSSVASIDRYAFYRCSSNLTIYCQAASMPSGWSSYWNYDDRPVVWDLKERGVTESGIVWSLSNSNVLTVRGYSGTSTVVEIPATINGYSVTAISDRAFRNCSSLTSITIPSSVTSIGEYAFSNCSSLTSITLPSNITSIGDYTFYYCSNLTSVTIPSSVTSIGERAFYYCSNLTSVTIPSSVTSIGGYAFYNCSDLTSVTFASGSQLTSIGDDAFYNCSSLTSITIPSGVTSIGEYAFYRCSSLTNITIPSSVTSIGNSAFRDCSSLTIYCAATSQPSGWSSNWNYSNRPVEWNCLAGGMDASGFYWKLTPDNTMSVVGYSGTETNLVLPSTINGQSVTAIADNAFYNNRTLKSVTIPDSVTSIGAQAFYGCSAINTVTIPSNITSIGSNAFYNCPINTATMPTTALGSVSITNMQYLTLNGGTSITQSQFASTIAQSVLRAIYIPSSVTSIDAKTFYNYKYLTVYCEAESRPSGFGNQWNCCDYLFYAGNDSAIQSGSGSERPTVWNCKEFGVTDDGILWGATKDNNATITGYKGTSTHIVIPAQINGNNVTTISNFAFAHIRAYPNLYSTIESVEIPSGVTSIGDKAFADCIALTSITISNTVKSIGDKAFFGCISLQSVSIPNSVTEIKSGAFSYCNLTSIIIPSSVFNMASGIFERGNSNLTIYCELESQPVYWQSSWNSDNLPVVWGYTG